MRVCQLHLPPFEMNTIESCYAYFYHCLHEEAYCFAIPPTDARTLIKRRYGEGESFLFVHREQLIGYTMQGAYRTHRKQGSCLVTGFQLKPMDLVLFPKPIPFKDIQWVLTERTDLMRRMTATQFYRLPVVDERLVFSYMNHL